MSDDSSSSSEEEEEVKREEKVKTSNCFFSLPGMKTQVEEEEEEEEEEEKRPRKKPRTTESSEKKKESGELPSAIDMLSSNKGVSFLESKRKAKEEKKIKSFEKRTKTREASSSESTDEECPNLGQMQRYQHKLHKEYRRKRVVGGDWAYRVEVGKNFLQDQADENDIEERRRDKSFSKRKWWNEDW